MEERKPALVRNTLIYAAGDIVPRLFSLITFPILTSYLAPADYGIINYVKAVNNLLAVVGILSLNTYFLVHYYRTEGDEAKRRLLGNLDLFIILFNLFLTAALFAAGPYIMKGMKSDVSFYPYMALGLGTSFFSVFKYLPSALFRLQERPLPLTIINICSGLFTLAGSVVAVVFIRADASSVLWSNLTVAFIFAVIFFAVTNRYAVWNINVSQLKEALKFSLPLLPGAVALYLYSSFDRVLMERELTLTDIGIYSTASTLALLLNIVSYGAYQAFEPYFFRIYGKDGFGEKFTTVRNILLWVCLSGAAALSCLGEEFFRIFTAEGYHGCYVYVPLISMGAIAAAMGRMYTTVVVARGRTKVNAAITIVGAVFSVSFNLIFLRLLGIWAACLSYFLTFTIVLLANLYCSRIRIEHLRAVVSCLLFVLTTSAITYLIHIDNIFCAVGVKTALVAAVSLLQCAILKINPRRVLREVF